jgi:hypothetical protein
MSPEAQVYQVDLSNKNTEEAAGVELRKQKTEVCGVAVGEETKEDDKKSKQGPLYSVPQKESHDSVPMPESPDVKQDPLLEDDQNLDLKMVQIQEIHTDEEVNDNNQSENLEEDQPMTTPTDNEEQSPLKMTTEEEDEETERNCTEGVAQRLKDSP